MTPAIKILQKKKCTFKVHKYDHDPVVINIIYYFMKGFL